jgi:preprotein translocase subunit SecB
MANEQPTTAPQKQLQLQKIYIKDLSFESPKAPTIFMSATAGPQPQINLRSNVQEIAPNTQEVTLTLTVEAKDKDSTVFLVEVAQAGVFTMQGFTAEERAMLLGSYCPNALYPFAREAVADVVSKGGFPQILLPPLNFDAMYQQFLQERMARNGASGQPAAAGQAGPPSGQPN